MASTHHYLSKLSVFELISLHLLIQRDQAGGTGKRGKKSMTSLCAGLSRTVGNEFLKATYGTAVREAWMHDAPFLHRELHGHHRYHNNSHWHPYHQGQRHCAIAIVAIDALLLSSPASFTAITFMFIITISIPITVSSAPATQFFSHLTIIITITTIFFPYTKSSAAASPPHPCSMSPIHQHISPSRLHGQKQQQV